MPKPCPLALLAACLLGSLAGCATTPEQAPPPRGPFNWDTRADPAEVEALRQRIEPWLNPSGAACLRAIVRERLDLAHGLLAGDALGLEPRALLLAALPAAEAQAWRPLSEGGRVPWRAAEEALAAAARSLAEGEVARELPALGWPTASQGARAAYLRLGAAWQAGGASPDQVERALASAPAAWAAARRLEEMRTLGGFALSPTREHAWQVELARLALGRGRALLAMQHAAAARALSANGAGDPLADRALQARAYLSARQVEAALDASEGAAALARSPAQRARAEALRGRALLLAEEPHDAAEAFERAQRAALQAGDEAGVLRQTLNHSVAWLRAGEAELAKSASSEVRSLAVVPTGPEAPDLLARRAIIGALAGLLAGELDPHQAAGQIEAALTGARDAGLVEVLDAYARLPERLRRGRH